MSPRPVVQHVVDDRVFLLGLDQHFRAGMKLFETKVLVECAGAVARRLGVAEADVPLEGYYGELPELARHFRLMRALQQVTGERAAPARGMPELARILEIVASPLYGRPQFERRVSGVEERMLLPAGRDPLSQALSDLQPAWSARDLVPLAQRVAIEQDDISLVGLAARAGDPVVLAALRESVVLHAEKSLVIGGGPRHEYLWRVGAELARSADRFIEVFNRLVASATSALRGDWMSLAARFPLQALDPIPPASAENAAHFQECFEKNEILGRCAHLGTVAGANYHWAVRSGPGTEAGAGLELHEFWDRETWTTERYRATCQPGRPPGGPPSRGGPAEPELV